MLKGLIEKRNALIAEMEGLLEKAKTETRAFNNDEQTRLQVIKEEIKGIDQTIQAADEIRQYEKKNSAANDIQTEQRALDEKNFIDFVKGEKRALTVAANGGIIPTHIADRIIEKVKELSPIYQMATVYNLGGDLAFPVYDEGNSSIGAAYVDDMQELTEGTGKFTIVKLENHIIGVLAKVSNSLMNRTDFDLISFIVGKVAQAIAEFLEKELIQGTPGKLSGISSTTNVVTTEAVAKVSVDDLIDLQMAVPEVYQTGAVWIMHKKTLKALRKLKDTNGEYILNKDATTAFGWSLLGKPVYISESVEEVETDAKVAFYGDMKGLNVKLAQDVSIQILNEKYATQHATGVVGYIEADSKVIEPQKIAALKVA